MREEEIGRTGHQNQIVQLVRALHLTSQVECAYLWDVELKVIPEVTGEVGVDSSLTLEVSDCITLVRVDPDQRLDDSELPVLALIRIIL